MSSIDGRISTVLAAKLAVPVKGARKRGHAADDALQQRRELLHASISQHRGREFGDGGEEIHAEFATALDAIACAEAIIVGALQLANNGQKADDGVAIGISLGDVREDKNVLFGSAVQTANDLCALARANEIVISGAVREQALERTDIAFQRLRTPMDQASRVSAYVVSGKDITRAGFAFVDELIRRRVFRAAAAYVVVSWILVQVASIVFPEFDAPRWAMRTLIVLLTVGFPLIVFLAWTIDFTSKGFRRTPHSNYSKARGKALQFSVVTVATTISAAVLWWVWAGYIEPTTQRPSRAAIKSNPVVAVMAPSKISGSDEIDWLGEGIANLIRNDLAESRHVIVLSQTRWNEITADAESTADFVRYAKNAGVDYLIDGEYLTTPSGIVLSSRIEDLENGIEIQGARLEENDAAGIIAAVSGVSLRVKQALKIPFEENVKLFAADFAVQNMEAYETYIAGLGYLFDFDYELAEQSFAATLSIAPEFHMARYRLAIVMQATGRSEAALLELNAIPTDADLTERERLYIEGAKSSFVAERDPTRSIEIYRELVEEYPYDLEGGLHLADAYWLDYQEDAAIAEFRRLANLHSYDPSSWMALGERLLDVGELDDAELALQKYVDMAPDDHYAVALLGNLSQLRGEYTASIDFYDRSLALKPGFAVATLGLARSKFMAGEIDDAKSLWIQIIDDSDQAAGFRIDAAFDLAGILRGAGQFSDAASPLDRVEEIVRQEALRTAMMLSTLGLNVLEVGDYGQAAALIEQAIAESPGVATRYLFARGMLELRLAHLDQLRNTVAEIRALALPADDPDRTEDKAANYLLGLAALEQGNLEVAARELALADEQDGYEYAIYSIGLARQRFLAKDLVAAESIARGALNARNPGDLRLDLELDRARGILLLAEILNALGSTEQARQEAQRFIDRWQESSSQAPELQRAYELLSIE